MLDQNIEFFNIAELIDVEEGKLLYRYPEQIINGLGYGGSIKGREKAKMPAMAEIRVLSKSPHLSITLTALDDYMKVFCYINDFQNGVKYIPKGVKTTIEFSMHERLLTQYKDIYGDRPYLWRIILGSGSRIVFHSLNSGTILPISSKPSWVLYGSSISQGVGALDVVNSYAFLTQSNLKIDIQNKGLSGSCLLEPTTVQYLSSIPCEGYILEIGANVRGLMDGSEFQEAFGYLIDTLVKKECPILVISILDMFESLYHNFETIPYHDKNMEFIKIMKDKINSLKVKNVFLFSSADWMTKLEGISADMLHPSNLGHRLLSDGLSSVLGKIINND